MIEKLDPVGNSLVQLRLCRRHYGASLLESFDEAKHKDLKEGDKFVDPKSDITFVKGTRSPTIPSETFIGIFN